jgi:hypothetical protein
LSADGGVNEFLQWENFANAVNVALFGNPYVFIYTVGIQREFGSFL